MGDSVWGRQWRLDNMGTMVLELLQGHAVADNDT